MLKSGIIYRWSLLLVIKMRGKRIRRRKSERIVCFMHLIIVTTWWTDSEEQQNEETKNGCQNELKKEEK